MRVKQEDKEISEKIKSREKIYDEVGIASHFLLISVFTILAHSTYG